MTVTSKTDDLARTRHSHHLIGWGLLAGGAFYFVGGGMHPKEDPPGVSLKEHMRIMFEDPAWYPAHAILLVGMALIAWGLVALVRSRTLAVVPLAKRATQVAALATVAAAVGTALHLATALDHDRIVAHESTPLVDVNNIVETITAPAFGFAIAALAVIGAMTRTLGGWISAPFAVIGGVGFGLAAATFLITDALDPLFPLAAGIAVWVIVVGLKLLRSRVTSPGTP
jgi:hypothetical protein